MYTHHLVITKLIQYTQFIQSRNSNQTKKEINMLFMSVDVDGSGSIDMEEFYPVFHEVCVCVCVCV